LVVVNQHLVRIELTIQLLQSRALPFG